MGTLLRYLTTAEACDFILICNGEFFFTHRTVLAANSPVLKGIAQSTALFGGEAHLLNEVSPAVLGKILTFVYRGEMPESYRTSLDSDRTSNLPMDEKFPAVDNFLHTVRGKPTMIQLGDGTTKIEDAITNKEKWLLMVKKQTALSVPYNMVRCNDYADVIAEVDLYSAAIKLDISALKEVAMMKIRNWFDTDLQAGCPISEHFTTCASYVLKEESAFTESLFGLCAKYLPVVESTPELVSMLVKLHPLLWQAMMGFRSQWKTESKQQVDKLVETKQELDTLKRRTKEQEIISKDFENSMRSRNEALARSSALAEARVEAASTMITQLEDLNRDLNRELLAGTKKQTKADADRETSKKKLQNLQCSTELLTRQAENLEQMLASKTKAISRFEKALESKEFALEQSRRDNQVIKDDLRDKNEELEEKNEELEEKNEELEDELDEMQLVFDRFMSFVNNSCPCCRQPSNIHVNHNHRTVVHITRQCCGAIRTFDGEQYQY